MQMLLLCAVIHNIIQNIHELRKYNFTHIVGHRRTLRNKRKYKLLFLRYRCKKIMLTILTNCIYI